MVIFQNISYLTLSDTISGFEFLFAAETVWTGAWVGLVDGSEGAEGGEQDPELEKLKALVRPSVAAGVRPDLARRRRFLSSSVLAVVPGGAQSRSFFKCPLPHRHPQALNAKS